MFLPARNLYRSSLPLLAALTLVLAASSHGAEESMSFSDGREIDVLYFAPEGAENLSNPPQLALLMAAGSGNAYMAKAQFWVGRELVRRGWAIAVPVSPDGRDYFLENTSLMPELIDWLYASHRLRGSRPLLVGMSGGGSRALQLAVTQPERFAGVIATPGRLDEDQQLDSLNSLPVFLRIGENDNFRWNRLLGDLERRLLLAGAQVDAALIPDGKHLFQLDWEELDRWLQELGDGS